MSKSHNKLPDELRLRAEKRLQEIKKTTSTAKRAELSELVHELEVHQIELEMQNEELQQARSELEAYLSKYTDLYDFAPVGYFTLNPGGLILQVNLTGVRMFGLERSRLINQHFGRFVKADSRPVFTSFLLKAFESRSQETLVLGLEKKGNETFFAHIEARCSENGQECRIALIDITSQKEAEDALQESERKYRTLFETMSQGVVQLGQDDRILSANPAAERILGVPLAQMQAGTWADLCWRAIQEDGSEFPEETRPSRVSFRTGKAVQGVVMGLFSTKTNSYVWLKIDTVPQFFPDGDRPCKVFITFEDITERKRMLVYNMLTPREKEVFNMLVNGISRQTISDNLGISPKTVDKHRENLMDKLNLYTLEGVMQFARLIGLLKS